MILLVEAVQHSGLPIGLILYSKIQFVRLIKTDRYNGNFAYLGTTMPLITCSAQKKQTLVEFYSELISLDKIVEPKIGRAMLAFITMTNDLFIETTLYGLTSHYRLIILAKDKWDDDWFVTVYNYGDKCFQFEYQMSETKSPWKYARVMGQAKNFDEARSYLITAMTESEGWKGNTELSNLYAEQKTRIIK